MLQDRKRHFVILQAVIAKYTDKSRYRPEYIFGDVYVDSYRIVQAEKSSKAKAVQWINGKLKSMKNQYENFIVVVEDNKGKYGTYSVKEKRLSAKENLFMAARQLAPSGPESENSQVD